MSSKIANQHRGVLGRVHKRIIVCCDGTWQDGLDSNRRSYTNVLRLARSINHDDERYETYIPQVVFYQAGIGSDNNLYARYVEGATGSSLGEKVQEAYGFISHNYQEGDEIFLFGFSRGAYTARMVAMFIGEIGVLNRTDMDAFADIFVAYQKKGKSNDPAVIAAQNKILYPWVQHDSPGKKRADSINGKFTIKCIGVFDTVGSLGLPEEVALRSESMKTIFGFPDRSLGEHIETAFHAMAINETRADFNICKFEQTPGGRQKGQILKQCWFSGSHADIGGGWDQHDLADLTLAWMISNVSEMLSFDMEYLKTCPDPVAPWGEQQPHDPRVGIYKLSKSIQRKLPTSTDEVTNEVIHPSVLQQKSIVPALAQDLNKNPGIVTTLMPIEQELKAKWRVDPQNVKFAMQEADAKKSTGGLGSIFGKVKDAFDLVAGEIDPEHHEAAVKTAMHAKS